MLKRFFTESVRSIYAQLPNGNFLGEVHCTSSKAFVRASAESVQSTYPQISF